MVLLLADCWCMMYVGEVCCYLLTIFLCTFAISIVIYFCLSSRHRSVVGTVGSTSFT